MTPENLEKLEGPVVQRQVLRLGASLLTEVVPHPLRPVFWVAASRVVEVAPLQSKDWLTRASLSENSSAVAPQRSSTSPPRQQQWPHALPWL